MVSCPYCKIRTARKEIIADGFKILVCACCYLDYKENRIPLIKCQPSLFERLISSIRGYTSINES